MSDKLITIFLLLVTLTFSLTLKAQDNEIDSLKFALKNAKHDTIKINILSELSGLCEVEDILLFAEPCLKLCEKCLSSKGAISSTSKRFYLKNLAGAFNNIGFLASLEGDNPKALEYYQKGLKTHEDIKDKMGISTSLSNIGGIYNRQGDIPKALEYYHKSLKMKDEIEDKMGMAYCLNNIGFIYDNLGDIPKALEYYHKSLKIQEEIKDKMGIANSFNNIGFIYNNQGDIPKALEYYQKSLKIKEEIKDEQGIANSFNNIGSIYMNQGDFPKALEYHRKSLKIREEIKDEQGIANSFNNIGSIYMNQGDFPKALEYHHKSLKIREEIKDKMGIAYSLNKIAVAMLKIGRWDGALEFATRSLQTAKELAYPENIKNAASTLKSIYNKQNNFKEALVMYELEIKMRDSINNSETKKASIRKQFQYLYEKKAAADSVKNEEEQKVKNAQLTAQQSQLKQEKTQRLALYGGLALVIAFLGFVYNRFKITQKQKVIIEKQKVLVDDAYKHLAEKNKEVMDSIHYAKRIQTALMSNENYINKQLERLTGNKKT